MTNPRPFNWFHVDHGLVRERSAELCAEINALLAKVPTLIEEEHIGSLADQIFNIYSEECALEGFSTSPVLIGTVYGQIASSFTARIDSIVSGLRRADRRSGGLENSRGKQAALKGTQERLSSMLKRKADNRIREFSKSQLATVNSLSPRTVVPNTNHELAQLSQKSNATSRAAFGLPPEEDEWPSPGRVRGPDRREDSRRAMDHPRKAAGADSRALLHFKQRGSRLVAMPCEDDRTAIANTFDRLVPLMKQVKSVVRSHKGEITTRELRKAFRNTDLYKALEGDDWQDLIKEFRTKRPAGFKNLTIALLARRTGHSTQSIATYVKPSKRRKGPAGQ